MTRTQGGGLHHSVLTQIGADLTSGTLAAGDVCSMEQLEGRYGVSRTVVREVVKVLESLGVVTSRRRVGVTIQPESAWEALSPVIIRWRLEGPQRLAQLREVSELRRGVEPQAARLAAERATPEQSRRLQEAAAGMAEYGERDAVALLLGEIYAAAAHFHLRLPELFCGFTRQPGEPPIAYPVACLPQAWAAGSVFMMLQAALGVSIDAATMTLTVDSPVLPAGVEPQPQPEAVRKRDLFLDRLAGVDRGGALVVDHVARHQVAPVRGRIQHHVRRTARKAAVQHRHVGDGTPRDGPDRLHGPVWPPGFPGAGQEPGHKAQGEHRPASITA